MFNDRDFVFVELLAKILVGVLYTVYLAAIVGIVYGIYLLF